MGSEEQRPGPSPEVAYRLQRRGKATGWQGCVTQWDGSLGSSPTGTGAGGWVEWRVSQISHQHLRLGPDPGSASPSS